ncbi:MAG: ankyrin repeat domain-containing protein [Gammaproteobacteria bacterium]
MLRRNSGEAKEIKPETQAEAKLAEKLDASVPQDLHCPIEFVPLNDFVLGSDGYLYNRSAIMEHMRRNGPKSPMTREALVIHDYSKLRDIITSMIHEFKERDLISSTKLTAAQDLIDQYVNFINVRDVEIERLNYEIRKLKQSPASSLPEVKRNESEVKDLKSALEAKEKEIKAVLEKAKSVIEIKDKEIVALKEKLQRTVDISPEAKEAGLLEAVRFLSFSNLKRYLNLGANVNAKDLDSEATALMMAVSNFSENPEEAKSIIITLCADRHIDLNAKDKRGCTALHRAVSTNNKWAVEYLLRCNANPMIQNKDGFTPLRFGTIVNKGKLDPEIAYLITMKEQELVSPRRSLSPLPPRVSLFDQRRDLSQSQRSAMPASGRAPEPSMPNTGLFRQP